MMKEKYYDKRIEGLYRGFDGLKISCLNFGVINDHFGHWENSGNFKEQELPPTLTFCTTTNQAITKVYPMHLNIWVKQVL